MKNPNRSRSLTTLERKGLLEPLYVSLYRYTHLRRSIQRPTGLRIYDTTFFDVCQGVFQKFLDFFKKLF